MSRENAMTLLLLHLWSSVRGVRWRDASLGLQLA